MVQKFISYRGKTFPVNGTNISPLLHQSLFNKLAKDHGMLRYYQLNPRKVESLKNRREGIQYYKDQIKQDKEIIKANTNGVRR